MPGQVCRSARPRQCRRRDLRRQRLRLEERGAARRADASGHDPHAPARRRGRRAPLGRSRRIRGRDRLEHVSAEGFGIVGTIGQRFRKSAEADLDAALVVRRQHRRPGQGRLYSGLRRLSHLSLTPSRADRGRAGRACPQAGRGSAPSCILDDRLPVAEVQGAVTALAAPGDERCRDGSTPRRIIATFDLRHLAASSARFGIMAARPERRAPATGAALVRKSTTRFACSPL